MTIRSLLEHIGIPLKGKRIFVDGREVDPEVDPEEPVTYAGRPGEIIRIRPDRIRELSDRFTYHPPTDQQIKAYGSLRTRAKEMAFLIEELCPDSEEKAAAFASLDLVVMNANASIARHS